MEQRDEKGILKKQTALLFEEPGLWRNHCVSGAMMRERGIPSLPPQQNIILHWWNGILLQIQD
jgi:hypothetical protein